MNRHVRSRHPGIYKAEVAKKELADVETVDVKYTQEEEPEHEEVPVISEDSLGKVKYLFDCHKIAIQADAPDRFRQPYHIDSKYDNRAVLSVCAMLKLHAYKFAGWLPYLLSLNATMTNIQ